MFLAAAGGVALHVDDGIMAHGDPEAFLAGHGKLVTLGCTRLDNFTAVGVRFSSCADHLALDMAEYLARRDLGDLGEGSVPALLQRPAGILNWSAHTRPEVATGASLALQGSQDPALSAHGQPHRPAVPPRPGTVATAHPSGLHGCRLGTAGT